MVCHGCTILGRQYCWLEGPHWEDIHLSAIVNFDLQSRIILSGPVVQRGIQRRKNLVSPVIFCDTVKFKCWNVSSSLLTVFCNRALSVIFCEHDQILRPAKVRNVVTQHGLYTTRTISCVTSFRAIVHRPIIYVMHILIKSGQCP